MIFCKWGGATGVWNFSKSSSVLVLSPNPKCTYNKSKMWGIIDGITWIMKVCLSKNDHGKFILHRKGLTNTYVFDNDLLDHQPGKWFIHHTVMAYQHPWGRGSTGGCIGSTRDEGGGPRPYPGALNCMNDEEFDRKNCKKNDDSFDLYLHVISLVTSRAA